MPLLDVTEAFDPLFMDTCTVYRILETIGQNGRVFRTSTPNYGVQAVIVPSSPQDRQRLPDYQLMQKSITLYSYSFRFQGPAIDPVTGTKTTHPDEIDWHGSRFVVRHLEDYSGYGQGFVMAIAESIQAIDGAPIPTPMGSA